jgi:hypothetical protein
MNWQINGRQYKKMHNFSQKLWTNTFLGWGAYGGTLFDLASEAIEPQLKAAIAATIKKYGGDAAVDVRIKYGSNPVQWILTAITGAIWVPGTVTVSGTVVKAVP